MMLTLGKSYRLSRCAGPDGKFVILAMDHRNNLRHILDPDNPSNISFEQMAAFKQELVQFLSPAATGVLLDPEYGLGAAIASNAITSHCGLIVALEETGYTGASVARKSKLLPDWSVEKAARVGAAAIKLLVYYHPESPTAFEQEMLVQHVGEACRRSEMPFFLEPLSFSLDSTAKRLPSAEKRYVVIETARRLVPLGVDVLKAEFPLDINEEPDQDTWFEACQELSEAIQTPWVLLSAGVDYTQFVEQTRIACLAGACGVLAGRAVWKEASELDGAARRRFYQETAADRIAELGRIISENGTSWTKFYPNLSDQAVPDWYAKF